MHPETATSFAASCRHCGGGLQYDFASRGLKCKQCQKVTKLARGKLPAGVPVSEFLTQERAAEEYTEVFVCQCANCGAKTTVEPHTVNAYCPYCSAHLMVDLGKWERWLRPHAMLPFRLTPEQVKRFMLKWASQSTGQEDLVQALVKGGFKACYVPTWVFQGTAECKGYQLDWAAALDGVDFEEQEAKGIRETERYVSGHFLCPAIPELQLKDVEEMGPWHGKGLVPFREEYLLGVPTYQFSPDVDEPYQDFSNRLVKKLDDNVQRRIILGEWRPISGEKIQITESQLRLVLLPVFIFTLVGAHGFSNIYINGHSGKTTILQGQKKPGFRDMFKMLNPRIQAYLWFVLTILFIVSLVFWAAYTTRVFIPWWF